MSFPRQRSRSAIIKSPGTTDSLPAARASIFSVMVIAMRIPPVGLASIVGREKTCR